MASPKRAQNVSTYLYCKFESFFRSRDSIHFFILCRRGETIISSGCATPGRRDHHVPLTKNFIYLTGQVALAKWQATLHDTPLWAHSVYRTISGITYVVTVITNLTPLPGSLPVKKETRNCLTSNKAQAKVDHQRRPAPRRRREPPVAK